MTLRVRTAKVYFIMAVTLFQLTLDKGLLIRVLLENGPFYLCLFVCAFGVLFGSVRAKAAGRARPYGILASLFAFAVLGFGASIAYYDHSFDWKTVSFWGMILGVVLEEILNKLFNQVDDTKNFSAVMKLAKEFIGLGWGIIEAWINKKNKHDNDSTKPEN